MNEHINDSDYTTGHDDTTFFYKRKIRSDEVDDFDTGCECF